MEICVQNIEVRTSCRNNSARICEDASFITPLLVQGNCNPSGKEKTTGYFQNGFPLSPSSAFIFHFDSVRLHLPLSQPFPSSSTLTVFAFNFHFHSLRFPPPHSQTSPSTSIFTVFAFIFHFRNLRIHFLFHSLRLHLPHSQPSPTSSFFIFPLSYSQPLFFHLPILQPYFLFSQLSPSTSPFTIFVFIFHISQSLPSSYSFITFVFISVHFPLFSRYHFLFLYILHIVMANKNTFLLPSIPPMLDRHLNFIDLGRDRTRREGQRYTDYATQVDLLSVNPKRCQELDNAGIVITRVILSSKCGTTSKCAECPPPVYEHDEQTQVDEYYGEPLAVVQKVKDSLEAVPRSQDKAVAAKFEHVLENNPGYKEMLQVADILNGKCETITEIRNILLTMHNVPLSNYSSWLFNDAVSTTRLFSVDEIGDNEMIFGEMRPRIRHRLPCIHITVGEHLGKNPTRSDVLNSRSKKASSAPNFANQAFRSSECVGTRNSVAITALRCKSKNRGFDYR
ncbi:hypothetical protein ANN_08084 [Periplaneta americana]|uniref:Uncharacterized protein n=1 Tax=Periplaneta americana TaxID=6978 RepID=A0ABQ8T1T7_PERAM|nr:hypothetical protein ANN_08084 [Periplaneta americana]